jgi:hypothetical protein
MPDLSSRRIVDPLLTNLALGFSNSFPFIGTKLYPLIQVEKEAGKYVKFDKSWFVNHGTDLVVGMGSQPRFIDFETSTAAYQLVEYAIGTKIFRREREESSDILALEKNKTRLVTEALLVGLEKRIADLVQEGTNYDSTHVNTLDDTGEGKYYWTNTTNADPIGNLSTAIDKIRSDCGVLPNVVIFGYDSAVALSKLESIQKLANPWPNVGIDVTPAMAASKLSSFLGIENCYIGMSQYVTTVAGTLNDIWSDNVILAYVAENPASSIVPTFGVTLRKKGRPEIQREVVPLSDETTAIIARDLSVEHPVYWNCGYLIKNTVE